MSNFFQDFEKLSLSYGLISSSGQLQSMDDDFVRLENWINKGYHAEMSWMNKNLELRRKPQTLFDGAKSYVIVAMPYNNDFYKNFSKFRISRYALLNDYHYALKNVLKNILSELQPKYCDLKYDFFVDTKPIFERSLAVNAGLGFIGKNSCLIIPQKGSWFFLGGVFTNYSFSNSNKITESQCGSCTKCADSCPTGAIEAPYVINANKCLSYLSIEHKGNIKNILSNCQHKTIMGCDVCQAVCPHNVHPTNSYHPELYNEKLSHLRDEDLENLNTSSDFKKTFKETAFERLGLKKLKENIDFVNQIL
jgi:epoxyqueuosine reductase